MKVIPFIPKKTRKRERKGYPIDLKKNEKRNMPKGRKTKNQSFIHDFQNGLVIAKYCLWQGNFCFGISGLELMIPVNMVS